MAPTTNRQDVIVKRVVEPRQWLDKGPVRRLVDLGGPFHLESLVGPLLVEFLAELVEALLLLHQVAASRTSRLSLQGPVHPFMAAVPESVNAFETARMRNL
jgi:hypothetical protein